MRGFEVEIKLTETDIFEEVLLLFKQTIDLLDKDRQKEIMDKLQLIMDKERTKL